MIEIDRQFMVAGELLSSDLVMSHVIAYLSPTFPEGEDFFVRSVTVSREISPIPNSR
ncbi:hypothetical protein [Nocardia sp. XZ_19_231]|uniref:hypothetical protein n=1 Tax=Nocardia sp. XZ_19_231 TaxID=2769252 RepID=UPI001E599948|nr:hypothetical protein [Nocardia sp. XZ_19_231]